MRKNSEMGNFKDLIQTNISSKIKSDFILLEKNIEEVIDAYFHERQTLIAENTLRKMNDLINTDYFDKQIDDANNIISEAALEIMDDDIMDELDTINDAYKKLIHYSEMKSLVEGYKACLSVMARI